MGSMSGPSWGVSVSPRWTPNLAQDRCYLVVYDDWRNCFVNSFNLPVEFSLKWPCLCHIGAVVVWAWVAASSGVGVPLWSLQVHQSACCFRYRYFLQNRWSDGVVWKVNQPGLPMGALAISWRTCFQHQESQMVSWQCMAQQGRPQLQRLPQRRHHHEGNQTYYQVLEPSLDLHGVELPSRKHGACPGQLHGSKPPSWDQQ